VLANSDDGVHTPKANFPPMIVISLALISSMPPSPEPLVKAPMEAPEKIERSSVVIVTLPVLPVPVVAD
jgi:hypothetical protein